MIGFSNSAMSTLKEAEFFVPDSKESSIIHMDLDRSFLPVPSVVNTSIFESFVRQNITDSETDVHFGIKKLVKHYYGGFPGDRYSDRLDGFGMEIIYGSTCVALFNKLVLCCVQEQGTFFFPLGTNGHYVSAAKFMNANISTIPTNSDSGFKIEPMVLNKALTEEENWACWVYISGPTINPSGFLYSDKEIRDLLSICAMHGARVVIDTSSSGLEFQTDHLAWRNLERFSYNVCLDPPFTAFMLGELSLGLTATGLDFGFLIFNDLSVVEHNLANLSQPDSTLKYTFRKLLDLKNKRDQHFSNLIMEQKETLKNRANHLAKVRLL